MNWADLKDAATGTEANECNTVIAGRFSGQPRVSPPEGITHPSSAAIRMADVMREIVHRDGHVTEAALSLEGGFSMAEIIEHGPEARRLADIVMTVPGKPGDRPGEIAEKCVTAAQWLMPCPAGTERSVDMKLAWMDYCRALAAHTLDPWISQRERTLHRLAAFLKLLPLLPREANGIIATVSGVMTRKESRT